MRRKPIGRLRVKLSQTIISLKQLADNFDNLNATWEADEDILNSEPFLEEHLILKKIRTLRATVRMTPCPTLLKKNGFIPIAQLKPRSQRQVNIIFNEYFLWWKKDLQMTNYQ